MLIIYAVINIKIFYCNKATFKVIILIITLKLTAEGANHFLIENGNIKAKNIFVFIHKHTECDNNFSVHCGSEVNKTKLLNFLLIFLCLNEASLR